MEVFYALYINFHSFIHSFYGRNDEMLSDSSLFDSVLDSIKSYTYNYPPTLAPITATTTTTTTNNNNNNNNNNNVQLSCAHQRPEHSHDTY